MTTTALEEIYISGLESVFSGLSKIGRLGDKPEDGYDRPAWSHEETKAIDYILDYAKRNGIDVWYDGLGNGILWIQGKTNKIVAGGSHLDTVPEGGLYDGGLGVAATLLTGIELKKISEEKPLERSFCGFIFRGEEGSSFGSPYKGSRGAFGPPFEKEILEREYNGIKLRDAVGLQSFNYEYLVNGVSSLSEKRRLYEGLAKYEPPEDVQLDINNIYSFLELHIEQAKLLEQMKLDSEKKKIFLGLGTSIRGARRLRFIVRGHWDHSGGTPNDRISGEWDNSDKKQKRAKYRSDANLAISYLNVAINEIKNKYTDQGKDLVATPSGINSDKELNEALGVYKSALNKVCAIGYTSWDIRSNSKSIREKFVEEVKDKINELQKEHNVSIEIENLGSSEPVEKLNYDLINLNKKTCEKLGYVPVEMPVGAGHDTAVVAKSGIPSGMILTSCVGGKSHRKDEKIYLEDALAGVNVYANSMLRLVMAETAVTR